jgi:hypothetical protein
LLARAFGGCLASGRATFRRDRLNGGVAQLGGETRRAMASLASVGRGLPGTMYSAVKEGGMKGGGMTIWSASDIAVEVVLVTLEAPAPVSPAPAEAARHP